MNLPIYFDNAATTALDSRVKEAILEGLEADGNPSSTHALGRKSKAIIESSRAEIAKLFTCHPSEIIFTSGGTEADNLAILGTVETAGINTIISSRIEHPAVIESIKKAEKLFNVTVKWVNIHDNGDIDLKHLEELLATWPKSLVSLMHVNNEIGNVLDIYKVGELCQLHSAIFHSDMVQSIGHFTLNLNKLPVDLVSCSAHKIHGPKGIGFLYRKKGVSLIAQLNGGKQEREARGGTENIIGIVGLAKALQIAITEEYEINTKISSLKEYFINQVQINFDSVLFNGNSGNLTDSVNAIVSLNFPKSSSNDMILFQLDLKGIFVSGGSACSSGSVSGSHVLNEINVKGASIRVSFSKENTKEEIDQVIQVLKELDL